MEPRAKAEAEIEANSRVGARNPRLETLTTGEKASMIVATVHRTSSSPIHHSNIDLFSISYCFNGEGKRRRASSDLVELNFRKVESKASEKGRRMIEFLFLCTLESEIEPSSGRSWISVRGGVSRA